MVLTMIVLYVAFINMYNVIAMCANRVNNIQEHCESLTVCQNNGRVPDLQLESRTLISRVPIVTLEEEILSFGA